MTKQNSLPYAPSPVALYGCRVLAALVIWLVIMNVTDVKMPGSVDNGGENQVASIGQNT